MAIINAYICCLKMLEMEPTQYSNVNAFHRIMIVPEKNKLSTK